MHFATAPFIAGKVNNCCSDLLRQTDPAKRDMPQKQIEEFLTQRHTHIHHGNAESLLCVRPSHGFDPCSRNGNLYSYRRRSHAGKAGLYQSQIRIGRIKNGWEAIPIRFCALCASNKVNKELPTATCPRPKRKGLAHITQFF